MVTTAWPKPIKDYLRELWFVRPILTCDKIADKLNAHPLADRTFGKNHVVGERHRQHLPLRGPSRTPTPTEPSARKTTRGPRMPLAVNKSAAFRRSLAAANAIIAARVAARGIAADTPPITAIIEAVAMVPVAEVSQEPGYAPDPDRLPPSPPWEDAPPPLPPEPPAPPEPPEPPEVVETATVARPTAVVVTLRPRVVSRPVIKADMLWFDALSARHDAMVWPPGKGRCQFPIGELRTPGFRFCGNAVWRVTDPKFGDSDVYCKEHAKISRTRKAS